MNTTFVTAYYNLSKSNSGVRSKESYLTRAEKLLSVGVYFVIFVEDDTYIDVWKIRQKYNLLNKTVFIRMPREEWILWKYKSQIEENRKTYWPTADSRCPSEVHTLVSMKFEFVSYAIRMNSFNTTHFGWVG